METITMPATYSNWVITPLEKVKINPVEITITFKYEEEKPNLLDLLEEAEQSKEVFNTHNEMMDYLNN